MSSPAVHRITIYPLSIPLRKPVTHDDVKRVVGDSIIVAAELINGIVGYGETLPRTYVLGESTELVITAIQNVLGEAIMSFHPDSFPEALELLEALPFQSSDGTPIPAARCAVELALLDATMRYFDRDMDAVVQWMGLPGFGRPGSLDRIRFSGVLSASDLPTLKKQLRKMYWGGLRHFKLNIGDNADRVRLTTVLRYLKKPLSKGKVTLRLDAHGAWTKDEAINWLGDLTEVPISGVEQPLKRGNEEQLPILHDLFDFPLIHDESLVTIQDAQRLIDLKVADGFDIRMGKCGGMLPALRLAALALRHGVRIQLGGVVSETSLLSAAGLKFLEVCPKVEWAEGCYGLRLLKRDIVANSFRFGFGGRPPTCSPIGLGVKVDPIRLAELCLGQPKVINY